ncbi:MAG TPA: hypothetical protein PLY72_10230, partial [Candidatus Obscuribacter sp.]|nr:hypothetical protein [Candidatus Obscuribacter sp.]
YISRAQAYLEQKKFQEALKDTTFMTQKVPDEGLGFFLHGKALMGLKRYKEAATAFDRAISVGTEHSRDCLTMKRECHQLLGKSK